MPDEMQGTTTDLLRAFADAMTHSAKAVKAVQYKVAELLLERGWFQSYYFHDDLILGLHQFFEEGRLEEVDEAMTIFARIQTDRIESELFKRFTPRLQILRDAFGAHREGKYTLSVPVFLSQGDGIGREVLGTGRNHIYQEKNREKGSAVRVRDAVIPDVGPVCRPDSIAGRMLAPLAMKWSLGIATEERDTVCEIDPGYGPLNRHGVLHGQDTEYGNERNSLRGIMLLGFLLDMRRILHEELPEREAMLTR